MAKNILIIASLFLILFLGNKLRSFSYAQVPHPGEVADEYAWGWLGLSLIKDKYPISWSLNSYQNTTYQKINVDSIYDKNPERPLFAIVKPNFDNPPFFGLISGGYAYFKGVRDFKDASVAILRRPMLKIAILTSILIFILASRFYGWQIGLLSSLLYSAIPTVVISSRLALIENGMIPLFLLSLIFADYYFEKRKRLYWVLAITFSSLAILFKLSGISVALSLFILALIYGKKDKKYLVVSVIAGAIISILIFVSYGFAIDQKAFLSVFFQNSQRFYGAGSEIILQIINQFRLTTNKFLTDGWITLGWISFFLIAFNLQKKFLADNFLVVSIFSYLLVLILFGGESYGWYRYPLFPFLIISLAKIIKQMFQKPNLFLLFIFAMIPFGSSAHRLLGIVEFQKYAIYLRIFSLVFFSVFALSLVVKNKVILNIQKLFFIITLIFLIWLSIKEIFYYTLDKWFFVT